MGVRAVLVARNDVPADQVAAMMALLFDGEVDFAGKLKSSMQPLVIEAIEGIPIAFHPGAGDFYAEQGINVTVMDVDDEGSSVNASQDD